MDHRRYLTEMGLVAYRMQPSFRQQWAAAYHIEPAVPVEMSAEPLASAPAEKAPPRLEDSAPVPHRQKPSASPPLAAVSKTPSSNRFPEPEIPDFEDAPPMPAANEPPPWLMEAPAWDDQFEPVFENEGELLNEMPSARERENQTIARLDWAKLKAAVSDCERCELAKSRTQTVFGVGNQKAELLIVGEAPGKDEDIQGEPFVGKAGQLLNRMLFALGLKREAVYIGNILKCRPPNNRDPEVDEADNCRPYLQRQIALLNPKVVVVVGRIAAQNLLQTDVAIGKLRGQQHRLPEQNIPVVVTYHPAYLLRRPIDKRKAWDDLKQARALLGINS